MWIIYKTTNKLNNKIYIGLHKVKNKKTLDPEYIGSGFTLKLSIKKYGRDNFSRDILHICETLEEANRIESIKIKECNSRDPKIGYNISAGGDNFGSTLDWIKNNNPEKWIVIREKLVENGKNSPSRFKIGHKLSKESIEKMKMNLPKKRKPTSEATKLKISQAKKGKPWTAEVRQSRLGSRA